MKLSKFTLAIATATTIFITGCTTTPTTVSEESLGLRKTDIYTEASTISDKTMYSTDAAGTSKKFDRAYENAPPMIPHDVTGMLPITIDNNACTGCHDPAIASAMNATPIPKSHFTDLRPMTQLSKDGEIIKDGKVVVNTSDHFTGSAKPLNQLSGSRFSCTQCHAPQSTGKLVIENEFISTYRDISLKNSSNLLETINEGVK